MHELHSTNPTRRGAGFRQQSLAGPGPFGETGRVIELGASDASAIRASLLSAIVGEGRASLFFLHYETGFPEKALLTCALALEQEGLVSVEGRPDGNTSRQMVALTARGRARGALGKEVDADSASPPTHGNRTNDESGEGGTR